MKEQNDRYALFPKEVFIDEEEAADVGEGFHAASFGSAEDAYKAGGIAPGEPCRIARYVCAEVIRVTFEPESESFVIEKEDGNAA